MLGDPTPAALDLSQPGFEPMQVSTASRTIAIATGALRLRYLAPPYQALKACIRKSVALKHNENADPGTEQGSELKSRRRYS